ncbi:gliding motility lipoprotein GldH [Lewinella sp. W8]|uniref:gliding motility lipoprotein GldH n=1 Tax=Lewinella sp. W8 TaxID=2528208 RepID=UPI00156411A4|nr:gliding motility lipoprotein GldH [Lewinella sp. W8]
MAFLPLCLLLTGCGPEILFERTQELPTGGWAYQDSVAFEFSVPDTVRKYDLLLNVTHDQSFPYQNFYVNIHTDFPNGRRTTQRVSLQLAGDFGAWLGDCGGTSCDLQIPVLSNARFAQSGTFGVVVEQYSRDEPLVGVRELGLRVEVAEEQ